jgi:hypothetical protein
VRDGMHFVVVVCTGFLLCFRSLLRIHNLVRRARW